MPNSRCARQRGHDDRVTAGAAWPTSGPRPRDDLDALSTATLADGTLGAIPRFTDPNPPGWTELVDGRGLYVRRVPGPDAPGAPPAWYIHGLAGASTNWTQLAGALSPFAAGYSVDLPGHGRSDPPPRGRYSLSGDADLIAGAIAQVSGRPVHLLGNSLGGYVATLLAARRPDLVRTLTLISPAVPDLRMTTDRGADMRLGLLLAPGTTGIALRRLASIDPETRARGMGELCFGDAGMLDDDDYAAAAAELDWRGALPWTHMATIASLRALMSSYLRPRRWSFRASAERVRVPVLVIWGTRDKLVDVRLAAPTAAAFADSRLLVLRGLGHVAQMEDPRTTALAALSLWRDVPARGATESAETIRAPAAGAPSIRGAKTVATSNT